jgi:hypothetical protein
MPAASMLAMPFRLVFGGAAADGGGGQNSLAGAVLESADQIRFTSTLAN